jgi:hypothetical protein
VTDVLDVVGAVQPEGTVSVTNEVLKNCDAELLVKVKLSSSPVDPADSVIGLTLIVPQPLPTADEQLTTEMVG